MTTTETESTETAGTPGIYDGLPAEDYHARKDSISSSGLRRLLPPGCPAAFRFGEFETSAAMDFGKVAHRLVLGDGDAFAVSPFDSFRSNDAKAWKAEQEAAGVVVISADDLAKARAMAQAVKDHPWAGQLFTDGRPEVSLFWTDAETGVNCRARFDWLRNAVEGRRLLIPDYKTARNAHPAKFAKSAAEYGYAQQAAFYIEGAVALGLDPDPLFLFVAQEKTAPYLVSVVALDEDDIRMGRELNRRALRIYADCLEHDEWPGYAESVVTVELPSYHRYATEEYLSA